MCGCPVTFSDARRESRAAGVAMGEKRVKTAASWLFFWRPCRGDPADSPHRGSCGMSERYVGCSLAVTCAKRS